MEVLGMTQSVCEACRSLVPARIESDGRDVFFRKFCPEHGQARVFVRSDVGNYLATQRFVKPAWVPKEFAGDSHAACPDGCGSCDRHEQHLCMPIVEVTSRCDLECPVCLVDAGRAWDMTLEDFRSLLDRFVRAEGQVDVLNLSGGEPLLHPRLLEFVDEALSRPQIVRVSVSTNGLTLLENPALVRALRERNVVVSLQFDGFDDIAYVFLRGRPLLRQKMELLDLLESEQASTSLTMTVAAGINDDEFRPVLEYLFSHEHVISLMIQPLAFSGRGAALQGKLRRLTIPDILARLGEAGHSAVSAADFVPLPCSHPLCFSLAFYLMLDPVLQAAGEDVPQRALEEKPRDSGHSVWKSSRASEHDEGRSAGTPVPFCGCEECGPTLPAGRSVAINRLAEARTMLDSLSNRVVFGLDPSEHERLKAMLYDLWSGPAAAAPDSQAVIATVRRILREMAAIRYEPRTAFLVAERRVKSIFIHAFQDAATFDLARVRRCCQAYPQPDGRFIPACVRNVLGGRR